MIFSRSPAVGHVEDPSKSQASKQDRWRWLDAMRTGSGSGTRPHTSFIHRCPRFMHHGHEPHEHRAPTDDYYTIDLRTHSHFDTCPSFEKANNIDISSTATGEGRSTKIIMDMKRRRRTSSSSSSSSCRRRRSAGITTHTNLFLRLVRVTTAAAMAILVLVTTTTTTTTITTTSMTSSLPVRLLLLSPSFFVMAQTYAPTTSHAPSISHVPSVPTTSPTLLGTDEGTTLQPTPAGEGTMAPATTTDAPSSGTPSSAIPVPVATVSLVLF